MQPGQSQQKRITNSFSIIAKARTEFMEMTDKRGKKFHELRVETVGDYPQELRIRFYSLTDEELYQNPKGLTVSIYGSLQGKFYTDNNRFHDWLVLRGAGITILPEDQQEGKQPPMDQAVVEEDDLPF